MLTSVEHGKYVGAGLEQDGEGEEPVPDPHAHDCTFKIMEPPLSPVVHPGRLFSTCSR